MQPTQQIIWGTTGYRSDMVVWRETDVGGWKILLGRLGGFYRDEPAIFVAKSQPGKNSKVTTSLETPLYYEWALYFKAVLWTPSGLETWGFGAAATAALWGRKHTTPLVLGPYVCLHGRKRA